MLGKGKLETGVKMTYRQNNIDHKMYEWNEATSDWQLSIPLSNDLRHREYIPAAYIMYSSKLSQQLTMNSRVYPSCVHLVFIETFAKADNEGRTAIRIQPHDFEER